MRSDNLPGLLSDSGLRPKSYSSGHTERMVCPRCNGGNTREKSLSLTIDPDGDGAVWTCFRGTCGWTGGGKVGEQQTGRVYNIAPKTAPQAKKPEPHAAADIQHGDVLYRFFEGRKISQETVDAFGCYSKKHAKMRDVDLIIFPYLYRGELVNRKARSLDKKIMQQDPSPLPTLFNIDAIQSPDVVLWAEGEIDVMALHEAGYPQSVSLKDGAPAKLSEEGTESKRFNALNTHHELLSVVRKFILAGDMDEPGMVLREEIARRVGKDKCWLVTWPNDCKDASDCLVKHGPDTVRGHIENAHPYPLEGVRSVSGDTINEYLDRPDPKVLTMGTENSNSKMKLPGDGRLIIVTGIPSSGKSSWTMHEMVHLMKEEGRRFLVFSPEMQPFHEFVKQCIQIYVGKPVRRGFNVAGNAPLMSRDESKAAGDWLTGRLSFLESDAEDTAPNLEWIMSLAKSMILREGVTDLLIDPWNEVEHARGNLTDVDYISRSLQRLKAFGLRHGCNVWIVVHPTKLRPEKPGQGIPAPTGYDINGGAMWFNKADVGITVHRPDNITEVILWKSRFMRWGRRDTKFSLSYDPETGRFSDFDLISAVDDRPEDEG